MVIITSRKKHIVNTMLLGFRGAKDIGILWCCLLSKKKRKNTTYMTIFGQYETEKKLQGVTTATTTTEKAGDILGNNSNPWGIAGARSPTIYSGAVFVSDKRE